MEQKRAPSFFEWFRKLGGVSSQHLGYEIERRLSDEPPPEHSFKERAKEVKELYNYKFDKHGTSKDHNV